MAPFNADRFFAELRKCEEPEQVDAAFSELEALPLPERQAAIDRVEALHVADWKRQAGGEGIEEIRMLMQFLEKGKDQPQVQFLLANMEREIPVAEALSSAQIVLNLHRLKGDAADPLIKTFVAEAAKLDDAEYPTMLGQMKLMLAVEDAMAAKPAARVNPFRQKPPAP